MKVITPSFEIMSIIDADYILKFIEEIGREAYKSQDRITDDSAKKFIRKIIDSGHESVIEHYAITIRVVCDRGVTHEIVRHRIASYTQESTRYCNYASGKFGGEITVIEPCFWGSSSEADEAKWAIWGAAMRNSEEAYIKLIDLGATPQEARSVLPNSLKTTIVITMNPREWRHFLKLRCSLGAHPQMREIAVPILIEVKKLIPVIFDDISAE